LKPITGFMCAHDDSSLHGVEDGFSLSGGGRVGRKRKEKIHGGTGVWPCGFGVASLVVLSALVFNQAGAAQLFKEDACSKCTR
jgi:hypothetical protein